MNKISIFLHHAFVPGSHNNFRGRVLSHGMLTIYLLAAIFGGITLRTIEQETGNVLGFATDINSSTLHTVTNNIRVNNGLKQLNWNDQLAQAATAKGNDMLAKGYWAHFGPNGESPWGFINGAGYDYQVAGENLAKNFMSSQDVVDGWMDSPTHRENIMRNDYQDVGYAVLNGSLNGEETTLVVQIFGTRYTPPIQPTIPPLQLSTDINTQDAIKLQTNTTLDDPKSTIPTNTTAPSVTPQPTTYAIENDKATTVQNVAVVPTIYLTEVPAQRTLFSDIETPPPSVYKDDTKTHWFNMFPLYRSLLIVFIGILIVGTGIDLYFASKHGFAHTRGKHMAHLIFLITMLILLFIIGKGSIL